jgi:LysR family transcriptional regulator, mexEF-oprN operon transcriptional activator
VIGVPGAVDVCLTGVLLRELAQLAPHINIVVRPSDLHVGATQLDDYVIDLAISVFPVIESWHRRLSLGWRNYACLFDPGQLPIRSPVRLKDYVSVNHVLTSFNGERHGVVDEALARIGQKRRIVAATMDFSSVPFYLASTASIATLPAYAAAVYGKKLRLTISPPPISLPDFELSMIWHARDDQDAGHTWFRSLLADVATRTTGV